MNPHLKTREMVVTIVFMFFVSANLLLADRSGVYSQGRVDEALQSCPSVEEEIVDLEILAEGLRGSHAVGFIEKLKLKSAIEELLEKFERYHDGNQVYSLKELQEQYDVLMIRIAVQLQHKDNILHGQLCNAWPLILEDLADPQRFSEKFA